MGKAIKFCFVIAFFPIIIMWYIFKFIMKVFFVCLGIYAIEEMFD